MRGLAIAALCALSGCGGCGDDTTETPDANDPDAEVEPDAEVPDAEPATVGPVTDFDAAPGTASGTVDVTWTNPAGAAGVIVVRHLATPEVALPVDGTTYAASDTLGTGDVVVYAGTGTAFTDTALPPGLIHYAAFARSTDDLWSTGVRDNALLAAEAQTATLTVNIAGGTVTVTAQPANYTLAATMTYDSGTDRLDVHVDATSGFARNVFAPKAVVTSVNQGTPSGDGTLDGDTFGYLGYAIAPAATGGADLGFDAVDGTVDPVLIELTIVDNPAAVLFQRYGDLPAYEWVDTATMTPIASVSCDTNLYAGDALAHTNGRCNYQPGAMSADATRIYSGHRALPMVREIDAATGTTLRTVSLDAGVGSVRRVALSPDGTTLYAILTIGGHAYSGGAMNPAHGTTDDGVVVEIDVATFTESARLVLIDDGVFGVDRLGNVAVSATGDRLAVPVRSDDKAILHFVDTATMTLVDTDAGTSGVQSVDLFGELTAGHANQAVYDSTGGHVYVMGFAGTATKLAKVDTATFAVTGVDLPDSDQASGDLLAGPGGVMYVSHEGDATAVSPAYTSRVDGATVTSSGNGGKGSLGLFGDKLLVGYYGELLTLDATTLAQPEAGVALEGAAQHGMLFTPF